MDESDLQVECPHCGASFAVADGPPGRLEACPVCQGKVRVLAAQEEALPAETAQAPAAAEPEDYFARRRTEEPPGEEPGPCLVCCAGEEKVNPLALNKLIRTFTGLGRIDAATQVTHGMGILAEGLAADTAANMIAALREEGVEAFAVPARKAPEPVDPVRYSSIHVADARGLHVQMDPKGTIRALRWGAVVAGVCTKERFGGHRTVDYEHRGTSPYVSIRTGAMYTGLGLRVHVKEEEAPIMLSLVLQEEAGRLHTMSVTAPQVRYAYLGERLQSSQHVNFLQFLTDVANWAQGAFFPPSYAQVAAGRPLAVREPVGRAEYNNYVRWAICCAVARGRL